MEFLNLLLSSLFALVNFGNNNSTFDKIAEKNYLRYLQSHDIVEYNETFVGNLYNNDYITSETMVTVLTHGMLGNKDYWFPKIENDLTFCDYLNANSLPFQIISKNQFSMENIPILSITPYFNSDYPDAYWFEGVEIYQLTNNGNANPFERVSCNSILKNKELFKNHVVLIYDLNDQEFEKYNQSNAYYSQIFQYSIDSFLAQTSIFYGGKLPRMNLIGHSRGGIANLYFADVREKLIDNIVSISTPYNGTILGEMSDLYKKICVEFGEEDDGEYYGGINGEENTFQSSLMLSRIDLPYKIAVGCENSPSRFLCDIYYGALSYFDIPNIEQFINTDNNLFARILNLIYNEFHNNNLANLALIETLVLNIKNILLTSRPLLNEANAFYSVYQLVGNLFGDSTTSSINYQRILDLLKQFINISISFCDEILDFDYDTGCIKSDTCIELDSQFCTDGNGASCFDELIKVPFGYNEFSDFSYTYLSNASLPPVAHNFESIYPDIANLIVTKLVNRHSIHSHSFINGVCQCGHNENNLSISRGQIPFYYLSFEEIDELFGGDLNLYGDEFNFRENYYYEYQILANNSYLYSELNTNVLNIQTTRLRTGFVRDESITLSPNRQDAGFAFIEFTFSQPIYCLSFDLSLWSSDEYINSSNLSFGFTIDNRVHDFIFGSSDLNNEYPSLTSITNRGQIALMSDDISFRYMLYRISPQEMSDDRNNPRKIYVFNDDGFDYIGFYAACNVTSSTKNKGRICIKNFSYYLFE